jgi:chemotaxis protein CheD
VLRIGGGAASKIPGSNIDFAFEYLAKEGIPVLASDVGGREPRKIFFFARTGKVLLKRIGPTLGALALQDDERYLNELSKQPLEGPITLFEQGT